MSPRALRHALGSLLVGAAALLFVVEEWLWDRLKQAMVAFSALPGLRQLERWIARLPPAGAAVVFLLPTSLVLPIKLVALKLLLTGHALTGVAVIIAAKLLATALFARIYVLTQPALMRVRWFVAVHRTVLRWRRWVYAQIESHPAWRAVRRAVLRWRAAWETRRGRGSRWGRRWRAVQRLDRMRRASTASLPSPP